MTDKNVLTLPGMKTIVDSLHNSGISFDVYSNVSIEPTDKRSVHCVAINRYLCISWRLAIAGFLFRAVCAREREIVCMTIRWKFVGTISYRSLVRISPNYSFGAVVEKDELSRFCEEEIRGQGLGETNYGQQSLV